jgi:polysaccharide export outer membrane protein
MTARQVLATGLALAVIGGIASAADTPTAPITGSAVAPAGSVLSADQARTYKLGPDDNVRIITYDEPQLTGQFSVDSNGDITLPLVGAVHASGLTVEDLRGAIETALESGYIKRPSVSVEVANARPFYILGEVNKPGQYPYTTRMTVMNAVATAGGFTYRANEKAVYIRHAVDQTETKTRLTATTEVDPGDTVRIGERFF